MTYTGTYFPYPSPEHPDRLEIVMDKATDVPPAKEGLEGLGFSVTKTGLVLGHMAIDATEAELQIARTVVQGPLHEQG